MGLPSALVECMIEDTPRINPDIARGLACVHLKYVEQYIDSVMRSAFMNFPAGLEYLGCRRCTPDEEWHETHRKSGPSAVFDVAKSDVYMMEYMFACNGVRIPSRFIYLPYVSKGGILHLGGSKFIISPVLADKVISVEINDVFVRLLKARLIFKRDPYFFIANNERENIQVAWAKIYNKKTVKGVSSKPAVRANHTMVHYLLCKYGFKETFERFANCHPVIGTDNTITEDKYPPNKWVICRSVGLKPRGFGYGAYIPSKIRVAVPIEEYSDQSVKNFIGGFFYIVDHFPQRVVPEYVDNQQLWCVLLGLLIWNDSVSEGKIYSDISDHFNTLDEYVDTLVTSKLAEIGYQITDIYQIFALIIKKFDEWSLQSSDLVSTMYDKELSILYYVCYDIIESIFSLYFKLKATQRKELNEKRNLDIVTELMGKFLNPGIIYRINHNHGEVSTTSTSGDNMFFRITSILIPQEKTNNRRKTKDKSAINDPSKWLHASIAEVGAVAALPKSEPTGRSRISPHLKISPTGMVLRNEELRPLLDNVQRMIKRRV